MSANGGSKTSHILTGELVLNQFVIDRPIRHQAVIVHWLCDKNKLTTKKWTVVFMLLSVTI